MVAHNLLPVAIGIHNGFLFNGDRKIDFIGEKYVLHIISPRAKSGVFQRRDSDETNCLYVRYTHCHVSSFILA